MHNKFMQHAIELSIENVKTGNGGPFGAVIVKNNVLIAQGANKVTSTNDPTAHAEIMAIRKACEKMASFRLDNCSLYTSCEPCPMCLGAAFWAHIKTIYFANTKEDASAINFDDSFIYDQLYLPYKKRSIAIHQIMRKEASKAFALWNKKQDKLVY